MAIVILPVVPDTPHQSFSMELDGTVYGISLRYNTRAGAWTMAIRSAEDQPLASGIAVRTGVNLLARYADAAFPRGVLAAVNFVEPNAEPDRVNFGNDCQLVYQEAS